MGFCSVHVCLCVCACVRVCVLQRRMDLLQVEPLCGLLNEKWNQFAGRLFLLHFLVYLLYLGAFTTIAYNKKDMVRIGTMFLGSL